MPDQVITCPHCQKKIPLSEAFRDEFDGKMQAEITAAKAEAEKSAAKKFELELKDSQAAAAEKEKELAKFRQAELELRQRARDLEEKERNREIENRRQLDTERQKIEAETVKRAAEEHQFKDAEKEKQITDLRKTIDELKRQSEVGSQQLQGEVLELSLENELRQKFPTDEIKPVEKGIRGADVLQIVRNRQLQPCGSILWELKRTKTWSDGWITKLKDDQRAVGAEIAVLVSTVLPKGITAAGWKSGVWITDFPTALIGAQTLRYGLGMAQQQKAALAGKNEKMATVYDYITSTEFRHKIEAIVESFASLRAQTDREKRAFEKIWKDREKQIDRVLTNTAGLYGDLSGIVGSSLPEIKSLSLEAGGDEDEGS